MKRKRVHSGRAMNSNLSMRRVAETRHKNQSGEWADLNILEHLALMALLVGPYLAIYLL